MGLNGVVVVDESDEFFLPVFSVLENGLVVPHLHKRPYHSLRFSVCSWGFHFCESLRDVILSTQFPKSVILISLVFQSVVRSGVRVQLSLLVFLKNLSILFRFWWAFYYCV